jgi:hypothetical protein
MREDGKPYPGSTHFIQLSQFMAKKSAPALQF